MTDEQLRELIAAREIELEALYAQRRARMVAAYRTDTTQRAIAAIWRISQVAVKYQLEKAAGGPVTERLRQPRDT